MLLLLLSKLEDRQCLGIRMCPNLGFINADKRNRRTMICDTEVTPAFVITFGTGDLHSSNSLDPNITFYPHRLRFQRKDNCSVLIPNVKENKRCTSSGSRLCTKSSTFTTELQSNIVLHQYHNSNKLSTTSNNHRLDEQDYWHQHYKLTTNKYISLHAVQRFNRHYFL